MKYNKKIISFLLSFIFIFSCSYITFADTDNKITTSELASFLLNAADDYNDELKVSQLIDGFNQKQLTRVEALVMVSRAFNQFPEPKGNNLRLSNFSISFSDIPKWAKEDINKLIKAGLLSESSDGKLNSDELITKAEIQNLVSRIFALYGTNLKDDFYSTINKQWLDNSVIEEGEASNDIINELTINNRQRINSIFEELANQIFEKGTKEQKISDLYKTAIDIDKRNSQGIEPIKKYLDIIDSANTINELVQADIDIFNHTGINSLFQFSISSDLKDSKSNMLYYEGINLIFEKGIYKDNELIAKLIPIISKYLILSGESEISANEKVKNIFKMNKSIAAVSLDTQDYYNTDKIYNLYTVEEFNNLYSQIDINLYLNGLGLKDVDKIDVIDIAVANKVAEYFNNQNLDLLKSYTKLNFLFSCRKYLSDEFIKISDELNSMVFGVLGSRTIEDNANILVQDLMSDYLGQIYIEKYFSPQKKEKVEQMVEQIVDIYKNKVQNLDWLSNKDTAIKKLSTLNIKIGYPDIWDTALDNIEINTYQNGGSLFDNFSNINLARTKNMISKFNEPVDKTKWDINVYEVNAYYNPSMNEIVVPAGIIQYPFYSEKNKIEQNLGGIGIVIGHEITHAFDNNGSKYDENGNINDWWTEEDYKKFEQLCQKAIDFYDGIEIVPNVKSNGTLTLSENISDIGGVSCILEYASKLENPDYEILFQTFAKCFAQTSKLPYLEYIVSNDVHSFSRLRINKTLSNFEQFYKTFNITSKDGMYVVPENRINIW